jgi:hypothetical protein
MMEVKVTHSYRQQHPEDIMTDSFQQFLVQFSHRVKVVYLGVPAELQDDAWEQLIDLFALGQPVNVEHWLDKRGAEEFADDFQLCCSAV